jgi:hypothetical protein
MSLTAAPTVEGGAPATVTSTRTATPFPSFFTKVTKSLVNPIPVAPGSTVTFRVTIQTGRALDDVLLEDIFAGAGNASQTNYVPNTATVSINGGAPTAIDPPAPATGVGHANRVVRIFSVGDLPIGTHIVTYQWKIADFAVLGCFDNASNEVHLRLANPGHLSTSTISFPILGPQSDCLTATPTAGSPTVTAGVTETPATPTATPTSTSTSTPTNTSTVTPTVTGTPGVSIDKRPNNVTTGRNQTLNYTVTFALGGAGANDVVVEDIISGLGRIEGLDASFNVVNATQVDASTRILPGTVRLTGPLVPPGFTPPGDVDPNYLQVDPIKLITNQLNRIVYHFVLGDLPGGVYTLTYDVEIADGVGCFATGHNQVHLYVNNFEGHPGQDTVSISVRCTPS